MVELESVSVQVLLSTLLPFNMIYFICWAVFVGVLIVATIVAAVMGNKGSRSAPAMPKPAMSEAFDEEAYDDGEQLVEAADDVEEAGGDDFAEFENEFS